MLRVAAYCRVSTDKDDQANSFESQKLYFETKIKETPDWKLVKIYADEGISGTSTKKRTEFNNMIRDAKSGKIDKIITKEVSRFARNTVDTLNYTRELKSLGIGVLFVNNNIDTLDEKGEFILTLMAGMAQEESRATSQRVKWGQTQRMKQGVVFGRNILGYHLENGVLTVNEEEAKLVRHIFNKYVEGKGLHIIAKELQEEGHKTKNGNSEWTNKSIRTILQNEKYVGDLLQKKTITPDFLTHNEIKTEQEKNIVVENKNDFIKKICSVVENLVSFREYDDSIAKEVLDKIIIKDKYDIELYLKGFEDKGFFLQMIGIFWIISTYIGEETFGYLVGHRISLGEITK